MLWDAWICIDVIAQASSPVAHSCPPPLRFRETPPADTHALWKQISLVVSRQRTHWLPPLLAHDWTEALNLNKAHTHKHRLLGTVQLLHNNTGHTGSRRLCPQPADPFVPSRTCYSDTDWPTSDLLLHNPSSICLTLQEAQQKAQEAQTSVV